MKKIRFMAVMATAFSLAISSCQKSMESQIMGKYEHPDLPGQTFEFGENGKYTNMAKAGALDCTVRCPGTWTLDGDSLIILQDAEKTTYEFGDSVTDEIKEFVKKMLTEAAKNEPERLAFKIAGVDSTALSLGANDKIMTYKRIE